MKPLFRETKDKKYIEVIGHYDNPILCAKLTLLADLYAIEHKEGYALFDVKDYDKFGALDDKLEFLTNLTNTKWVLNSNASFNGNLFYYIHFTSNSQQYISLECTGTLTRGKILYFKDENIYDEVADNDGDIGGFTVTSWVNEAYRIIEITGGYDTTNVDLISWLISNATQVPVVDLSNTKWVIKDYPDQLTYGYDLNFISNNTNFTGMMGSAGNDAWNFEYYGYYSLSWLTVYDGSWLDNAYKTISISNGTDATNPDLIVWLTENATYQEPQPEGITYDLTQLQLSAGTHTVQVRARGSGYRDSEFSNSVSYTVTQTGYQVTLTNQTEFDITVYDGQDTSGIMLETILVGETKTYTIRSGYIYNNSVNHAFSSSQVGGTADNPYEITSNITLYIRYSGGTN